MSVLLYLTMQYTVQCLYYCCLSSALCSVCLLLLTQQCTVQWQYYCASAVHCTVSVLLQPQQHTVQCRYYCTSAVHCAASVLLLPQQYTVHCLYYCTSAVHCTHGTTTASAVQWKNVTLLCAVKRVQTLLDVLSLHLHSDRCSFSVVCLESIYVLCTTH